MIITNKLKMDLQNPGITPIINAVQNDRYSRNVEITMCSGERPFVFPPNGSVVIRYQKSDGKGGEYDTLPDGTTAWQAEKNVLTIALAPQVLTTPGSTDLSISIIEADKQLSIFPIHIAIQPVAAVEAAKSENYFYVTGFLHAPESAKSGQYLRVSSVNDAGQVTGVEAIDLSIGSGGNISEETDPTVPDWAKQSQKPTYTAEEVGADASGTASAAVKEHNENKNSHTDIRQILDQLSETKADTTVLYVSITGANGVYTADKTTVQITEAYSKGQPLNCIYTGSENEFSAENLILPLLVFQDGMAIFGTYIDGVSWMILHYDPIIQVFVRQMASYEDIPKVLPNPCKLTFLGATTATYDGTLGVTVEIPEPDGYTPVRGVDYWTEADQDAIVQQVIAELGTSVLGTVDENNSIVLAGSLAAGTYRLQYEDNNGDKAGTGELKITNYKNQIPISLDIDGTIYNETGYRSGSRISTSSGTVSVISNPDAANAVFTTGFIPVNNGDVIRLRNCWMDTAEYDDSGPYGHRTWALAAVFYTELNGAVGDFCTWSEISTTNVLTPVVGNDGYVRQFAVNTNCKYMRIVLAAEDPSEAILTINEEIE